MEVNAKTRDVPWADCGGEVLGEGQLVPSSPAMASGERYKLPNGVLGRAPAAQRFSCIVLILILILLILY